MATHTLFVKRFRTFQRRDFFDGLKISNESELIKDIHGLWRAQESKDPTRQNSTNTC